MKLRILISLLVILLLAIVAFFLFKRPAPPDVTALMNADKTFAFPLGFPPDPGEAGLRTLEGMDSDHDGIRDDVQRWIFARFPNDARKRRALRQSAKEIQAQLTATTESESLEQISKLGDISAYCLGEAFTPEDGNIDGYVNSRMLDAKILNTRERTEKYLRIDEEFDGKVFTLHDYDFEEVCDP